MVALDSNKSSMKCGEKHLECAMTHFKMCISTGGNNLKCEKKAMLYLLVFDKECVHQNLSISELANEE